jgi:uncharacterized protein (TIGR02996 family)
MGTTTALDITSPDYRAFVDKMRASRSDDTDRLVFADWVEEKYPKSGFGPFIRASCALADHTPHVLTGVGWIPVFYPGMFPGWQPLYDCHCRWKATWRSWHVLDTLAPEYLQHWVFKRGFPERVVCDWGYWTYYGDTLCSIGPVGEVVLVDRPPLTTWSSNQFVHITPVDLWMAKRIKPLLRERVVPREVWENNRTNHGRTLEAAAEEFLNHVWEEGVHVDSLRIDRGFMARAQRG